MSQSSLSIARAVLWPIYWWTYHFHLVNTHTLTPASVLTHNLNCGMLTGDVLSWLSPTRANPPPQWRQQLRRCTCQWAVCCHSTSGLCVLALITYQQATNGISTFTWPSPWPTILHQEQHSHQKCTHNYLTTVAGIKRNPVHLYKLLGLKINLSKDLHIQTQQDQLVPDSESFVLKLTHYIQCCFQLAIHPKKHSS